MAEGCYYGLMRVAKKKYVSPILLSLLHFLPSLLLIGMVVIALIGLRFGERKAVLGAQSNTPQIRTMTVEDRIKELSGATKGLKSEAVMREKENLAK